MDGLAKVNLVDRKSYYVLATIPRGAGIGHLIQVFKNGSTMNVSREINQVWSHQEGHRQSFFGQCICYHALTVTDGTFFVNRQKSTWAGSNSAG